MLVVVVDADGAVRQAQLLAVCQRLLRADARPPPHIALTGHRQEGGKIIQSAIRCYMPMTHVLFLEVKVSRNSGPNTRIVTKWPITYSAAIPLLHVKLLAKYF